MPIKALSVLGAKLLIISSSLMNAYDIHNLQNKLLGLLWSLIWLTLMIIWDETILDMLIWQWVFPLNGVIWFKVAFIWLYCRFISWLQQMTWGKRILYPLYLFVIGIEGLSSTLMNAKYRGGISGIQVTRYASEICHLLFDDHPIIFCKANLSQVDKVMAILREFERVLGQQINLSKSVALFSPCLQFRWEEKGIMILCFCPQRLKLRLWAGNHLSFHLLGDCDWLDLMSNVMENFMLGSFRIRREVLKI